MVLLITVIYFEQVCIDIMSWILVFFLRLPE